MARVSGGTGLLLNSIIRNALYLGPRQYLVPARGAIRGIKAGHGKNKRLVILAKQYYFETVRSFPFSNVREIKDAIKLDMGTYSPFTTGLFFVRKLPGSGERARANLWFVDPRVIPNLHELSPFFIIPETALFCTPGATSPAIYAVERDSDDTLFVHVGRDGAVRSLVSRNNGVDSVIFRRSIGREGKDCQGLEVNSMARYLRLLRELLSTMPIKGLLSFLVVDSILSGLDLHVLKRGLGIALALLIIYTCMSTGLPYYNMKRLKAEDRMVSANLASLLTKQKAIEELYRKHEVLAGKINNYPYKLPILLAINEALPEGVAIRRLDISDNRVVMRGEAPKASQVLAALNRVQGVKGAGFSSPLRKERKTGMEVFALSFQFGGEGQ